MELQSALSSDERNIASCVAESALSGPTASNAEKRRRQAAADPVHGGGVEDDPRFSLTRPARRRKNVVASCAMPPDVVNTKGVKHPCSISATRRAY